jgi:ribosomal protein S12 methylthiotransferase accessory factor
MQPESRVERRKALAREILRQPSEVLKRYGITRVGEVTGLDHVGIPVWTACRPLSATVSITAGKNLDSGLAKAAAIIEAMEFGASEEPRGEWRYGRVGEWEGEFMRKHQATLVCDSLYEETTPIVWEEAFHLNDQRNWWVPSDLVWMATRVALPFPHFQSTSSGIAGGYSPNDAVLQALYEVVERDAWTLSDFAVERVGKYPGRVNLSHADGELGEVIDKLRSAGLESVIFDATREFGISVMWASLFDPSLDNPGTFGGFGCSMDGSHAVYRALMEAVQSRACYISGARDDLWRHQFLLVKRSDPVRDLKRLRELPETTSILELPRAGFVNPQSELEEALERLRDHGVYDLWVKPLDRLELGEETLHIVRVIASGLETYRTEQWAPTGRAWRDVERVLNS